MFNINKLVSRKAKLRILLSLKCAALCLAIPSIAMAAGPAPVNLLSAGSFAILAKTGITNTGSHTTLITGDIGNSPGTSAQMDGVWCSEVTSTIYGVDAAYTGNGTTTCFAGTPPTPNKTFVDNAVLDMQTAYTNAAGRPALATNTNLFSGNLGGQTIAPGLYKWTTDVIIPSNVTLSGGANDVWIFQIAGNLDVASAGDIAAGIKVRLINGAKASNVFWQVGGVTGATLGTYATFNGTVLAAKQIIVTTGAVLNGRALSQTQVTLDADEINGSGETISPHVCKSISLLPNSILRGRVNQFYNQNLVAQGGKSPYRFTITNGSLHNDLSLSESGVISGQPTTRGRSSFTVTAKDKFGCKGKEQYIFTTYLNIVPQPWILLLEDEPN